MVNDNNISNIIDLAHDLDRHLDALIDKAKGEGRLRQVAVKAAASLDEKLQKAMAEIAELRERAEKAEASNGVAMLLRLRAWLPTGVDWGQGYEAHEMIEEIDRMIAEAEKKKL